MRMPEGVPDPYKDPEGYLAWLLEKGRNVEPIDTGGLIKRVRALREKPGWKRVLGSNRDPLHESSDYGSIPVWIDDFGTGVLIHLTVYGKGKREIEYMRVDLFPEFSSAEVGAGQGRVGVPQEQLNGFLIGFIEQLETGNENLFNWAIAQVKPETAELLQIS